MSLCVDCGSELDGGERYCQVCGSPIFIQPLTEKELRDLSTHDPDGSNPQQRTKIILLAVILIILLIFVYLVSMMVGRLGSMGGRFY
ncbi:hypothetical protein BMS3Abin16_00453 [archaeon BMS3Abin16]|nr:hypothetical protein BMS3Abin16_00453 [archaeon BMS3Abin16]